MAFAESPKLNQNSGKAIIDELVKRSFEVPDG